MAIPTERVSGAIDVQLKALNSGGVMTEAYPITVVEDVIGLESKIQTEIASAGSIKFEVVDALPTTGQQANVIYLVPAAGTLPEQNIYDEYIWMVASGTQAAHWEIIGTTQTDVSNKMNKSGTYTNNHILLGLAGGTAIDGGKYLGSNTFNGTPSNYMAREDGVVNYVSKRVVDATSSYKASKEAFGVVKIGGNIDVSGGVISVPLADTVSSNIPGVVYATSDAALPEPVDPTVPTGGAVKTYVSNALISAFGAQTLTGSAPIVVSGGTVSITSAAASATPTSSGAVKLYNTASNKNDGAITPAAVSTGLAGKLGKATTYSANHLLKINAANGTSAVDAGVVAGSASFNTTAAAGSSTLATEAGVSAYVAAASPKEPLAGYTATSSGVMYVVSSGGALTITSGGLNIKSATATASGAVILSNGIANVTTAAVTPAAVSTALTSKTGKLVNGTYTTVTSSGGSAWVDVGMADEDSPGLVPGIYKTGAAADIYSDDNVPTMGMVTNQVEYWLHGYEEADIFYEPAWLATSTTYGVVKIGSNINVNTSGVISITDGSTASKGVVKLQSTINTANGVALTPGAVNTFITGISGVAPINENLTATGGTISISSATTTQSGAVLIMAGGTFTSAANKVATEGAVFSNCIFYSIV